MRRRVRFGITRFLFWQPPAHPPPRAAVPGYRRGRFPGLTLFRMLHAGLRRHPEAWPALGVLAAWAALLASALRGGPGAAMGAGMGGGVGLGAPAGARDP